MDKSRQPKLIIDDLTAVCNSIGKIDENDGTYMKDRDCKPCLRELLRYLSSDTDKHLVRSTLGALNIIKSDLIPLMVQYCDYTEGDPELFTIILRLCTNLTSPALLLFENQEIPSEIEQLKTYNEILNSLYGYKDAFATDDKIWSILNVHLRHNTDDDITFERLIILIRNILHIPVDSTGDMGTHSDFDAHDMCLYRMDKSGMLSTILHMASETQKGTEFCFHLTEIIYLMLRDQNPKTLASAKQSVHRRRLDDSDLDKKRLAELSARDRRERQLDKQRFVTNRFKHTSYVVQNYRSLSGAPLISNKFISSKDTIKFDQGKTELRKARNKKPLTSETSMMISDRNIKYSKVSYSLKIFSQRFVEKIYNNYMQQIKHNLIQKKAQENDESYYLWAMQFFVAFNRNMKLPIDNISETLSTSSLHFIQILITTYQEKLKLEKKKFHDISKRLHLALRAYREMLYLMRSIDQESEFSTTVETIQRNIFTETEYSTIVLNLFQQYEEPKHSGHYLKDLIQTNHIFMELYEMYSREHGAVEVDENDDKSTKKRKRKSEFRTAHFMTRYCSPDVIKVHLIVLKDFKTNEDETNLAILKLFERIVYDCHYETILCQASVFRCLIDIMEYHTSMPGHEGFKVLGRHLIETFASMANKKRWMFQELLFWKTANDVLEIENAIDPPPPMPVSVAAEAEASGVNEALDADVSLDMNIPLQTRNSPLNEIESLPPRDTIEDLMAELNDSSDESNWDPEPLPELDVEPPSGSSDRIGELNEVSTIGSDSDDALTGKANLSKHFHTLDSDSDPDSPLHSKHGLDSPSLNGGAVIFTENEASVEERISHTDD